MTGIPDLNYLRCLNEINWFRYPEKYGRDAASLRCGRNL